jgi:hypothetical protein
MDKRNEYGTCWEDILRKNDAENKVADAELARWAEMDKEHPGLAQNKEGYDQESMRREWEEKREKTLKGYKRIAAVPPKSKPSRQQLEKPLTGREWQKRIAETSGEKDNKKTKQASKRMVKKGLIKTIDSHFKPK